MKFVTYLLLAIVITTSSYALEVQEVSKNIYALVGERNQRSESNLANNATFGVVVTSEGVILMDPGGSWLGAKQIDEKIKTITNLPVRYVINTGGQDHRWLGNDYWRKKGAKIIASTAAVEDHKNRETDQFLALQNFLGDKIEGTIPAYADITFDLSYDLKLGNITLQIHHEGQAHTPGDSFVYLPNESIVFAGDIIYVERILGVGPQSNAKNWITVIEKIMELNPKIIVPGHGHITTLENAKAQSYDYLVNLREKVALHLENEGDLNDATNIDQSQFKGLEQFDALAKRNALQVYIEMEWE